MTDHKDVLKEHVAQQGLEKGPTKGQAWFPSGERRHVEGHLPHSVEGMELRPSNGLQARGKGNSNEFPKNALGVRPERTEHEQHEVRTSGTKFPHQGKRARETKAESLSPEKWSKKFLGQESNLTDKTVLENGKHIPKVGEKDGKQESCPGLTNNLVKKKGKKLKVKKKTQCHL